MSEEIVKVLSFEVERVGTKAIVTCHGRLVAGTAEEFYQEMKQLVPATKLIIVEMKELSYVDSMGLGALVRLYVHARNQGSELKLLHLGKQLRNLLTMTNLASVFGDTEDHGITVA
jgi:anti-sigma B factor antagonist